MPFTRHRAFYTPLIYFVFNCISDAAIIAQGVVLAVNRGVYTPYITVSATDDAKLLSTVLRNSNSLIGLKADSPVATVSETSSGKTILYLCKPAAAFHADMRTLNAGKERSEILWEMEGTYQNRVVINLEGKRIQMEYQYAVLDIVYVRDDPYVDTGSSYYEFATADMERQRIIEEHRKRAEKEAWAAELSKIKNGFKTRWTSTEVAKILNVGKLDNYVASYRFHVEEYPELALSRRNIVFRRQSDG